MLTAASSPHRGHPLLPRRRDPHQKCSLSQVPRLDPVSRCLPRTGVLVAPASGGGLGLGLLLASLTERRSESSTATRRSPPLSGGLSSSVATRGLVSSGEPHHQRCARGRGQQGAACWTCQRELAAPPRAPSLLAGRTQRCQGQCHRNRSEPDLTAISGGHDCFLPSLGECHTQ